MCCVPVHKAWTSIKLATHTAPRRVATPSAQHTVPSPFVARSRGKALEQGDVAFGAGGMRDGSDESNAWCASKLRVEISQAHCIKWLNLPQEFPTSATAAAREKPHTPNQPQSCLAHPPGMHVPSVLSFVKVPNMLQSFATLSCIWLAAEKCVCCLVRHMWSCHCGHSAQIRRSTRRVILHLLSASFAGPDHALVMGDQCTIL